MFASLLLPLGDSENAVTRIRIDSFEANTRCRFSNEVTALRNLAFEIGVIPSFRLSVGLSVRQHFRFRTLT